VAEKLRDAPAAVEQGEKKRRQSEENRKQSFASYMQNLLSHFSKSMV